MRLIDGDALIEALHGIRTEFVKHPTFLRSDIEEGIDRGVGAAVQAIMEQPTVDGVSKAKVKELIWSGLSIDTDADKEYVCGLIDELEG